MVHDLWWWSAQYLNVLGTVPDTPILKRFRNILKLSIEIANMYIYDFGPKAILSNAGL